MIGTPATTNGIGLPERGGGGTGAGGGGAVGKEFAAVNEFPELLALLAKRADDNLNVVTPRTVKKRTNMMRCLVLIIVEMKLPTFLSIFLQCLFPIHF